MSLRFFFACVCLWIGFIGLANPFAVAQIPTSFFTQNCLDCHSGDSAEAKMDLESPPVRWEQAATPHYWQRVLDALEDGRMPPPDADQPTKKTRQAAIEGLQSLLAANVQPGGTLLRRLNQMEYENSVSAALGISFKVPSSFPVDQSKHGFDNLGEGLILSPPLLQQYFELATVAADAVIPPARENDVPTPKIYTVTPKDFSWFFTAANANKESVRVVTSSSNFGRSGIWPSNFEARESGVFAIKFRLQSFNPPSDQPMKVSLVANRIGSGYYKQMAELRTLASLEVPSDRPLDVDTEIELHRGEVFGFHLDTPTLDAEKSRTKHLEQVLRSKFAADPRLHAAWLKVGFERRDRAAAYWDKIQAAMLDPELSIDGLDQKTKQTDALIKLLKRNPVNVVEALAVQHYETGPAVDVSTVQIRGPLRYVDGPEEKRQKQITEKFIGNRDGRSDSDFASDVLRRFLTKAFRRPATDNQVAEFTEVAMNHVREGNRWEDGIHLAVRSALCSPRFLYRGHNEGTLDSFDLAARLSYFLTGGPPDQSLQRLAERSKLETNEELESATRMLLKKPSRDRFVKSFTGQWLGTRRLIDIMPDERLMYFNDKHRKAMISEIEMSFSEILDKNLPIETFINPDFTYLNNRLHLIYRFSTIRSWPAGKAPSKERLPTKKLTEKMVRVAIPKGDRVGGILGQAGVMMATANGVDTQPVLRGVWLLENVFGDAPPPPPSSVPAIEPDTTGATSIREQLEKHRADSSCAVCHRSIDPPGFALENFDPIGRWRDHYPVYKKQSDGTFITNNGPKVDASGVLADGTRLNDVRDLKRYLTENPQIFARCLTEKLLVYATGRPLNFADKQIANKVAAKVVANGGGFRDLIIAIVQCESFRTR